MFCKLIFLFCGLCCTANALNSFRMRVEKEEGCHYKGYVPGGRVMDVDRIKAPEAVLAQSAMSDVLGRTEQAAALAGQSAAAAKAFLGVMEATAGKMGPVLGVFGIGMGIMKSLTEIKPKEILAACNEAIAKLTDDMNDRLQKMQGYIDTKVINLEKRMIKDSYEKYYILWRNCIDEPNADDRVECQEKAYAAAASALPRFAVYNDKLSNLEPYKARELEAYLFVFRDYANLVLMMLKPLVQTFHDDKSKKGVRQYNRYSRYITEKTSFFIKYTRSAVQAIIKAHKTTPCAKTMASSYFKEVWEGDVQWWKDHTANRETYTCTIDDGTRQQCKISTIVRVDGKNSYNRNDLNCPSKAFRCATKELSKTVMGWRTNTYTRKDSKIVAAFWKKEILDFIPVWSKAYEVPNNARRDAPLNVLSDEPDIFYDEEPEEKAGAEKRQIARLAKAEKELNMLHKHM